MPPFTRSQARNAMAATHPAGGGNDPAEAAPQTTNQPSTTVGWQTAGTSGQAQSAWPTLSSLSTLTDSVASVESVRPPEPRAPCMSHSGQVHSAWSTLSSLSTLTESAPSQESARPHTPENRESWTPGSVVLTPRKLGPSPRRIGGHGIDFWRDGSGVVVQGIVDEQSSSQNNQDLAARSQRNREAMRGVEPMLVRRIGERERQIQAEFEASQQSQGQSSQIPEGRYGGSLGPSLQNENSSSHDEEIVEDDPVPHPAQAGSQRLGPEGTILIDSESWHSSDGSQALGLQPTEIIGGEEQQSQSTPRRAFPSRPSPNTQQPFGLRPTEPF